MTTCPHPRAIGVEIQGVHDGVLYEACPDCGGTWHHWDPVRDPRRWAAAERHRATWTAIHPHPTTTGDTNDHH